MSRSNSDNTERRQQEEELRRRERQLAVAEELAKVGSVERNIETGEVWWTDQLYRMLGYEPGSVTPTYELFLSHVHPDDRTEFTQVRSQPHARGGDYKAECRLITASGEERFVENLGRVLTDESGKPIHFLGVTHDITERVKAEQQLRRAQRLEAIGLLTGGIAHDFNNLLTIILGNAEILDHQVEGAVGADEVARIVAAVDRGSALTNRLLAFARKQSLSPQTVVVTNLIEGVHELMQRTLGEAVVLQVKLADNLWTVTIDPSQFENAILNLSINARDAMPEGGRLLIEAANVTLADDYVRGADDLPAGDYVCISVSDNGCGIPAAALSKVFESFFTTKAAGEGSGLGLSMVYGFIKQSGGHVTIYSEVGEGTTVKLYLPRADGNTAERELRPKSIVKGGNERILIVEDNDEIRRIPELVLTKQGYDVVSARDGNEALRIAVASDEFDLLFTDIVLPGGINGIELSRQIRGIYPNIKILYTSGFAENGTIHNAILDTGAKLLRKPYSREELMERIREALDS